MKRRCFALLPALNPLNSISWSLGEDCDHPARSTLHSSLNTLLRVSAARVNIWRPVRRAAGANDKPGGGGGGGGNEGVSGRHALNIIHRRASVRAPAAINPAVSPLPPPPPPPLLAFN